jgi:hypothetical protein
VVEGTRLEIERRGNSSVGSNPTLSAQLRVFLRGELTKSPSAPWSTMQHHGTPQNISLFI